MTKGTVFLFWKFVRHRLHLLPTSVARLLLTPLASNTSFEARGAPSWAGPSKGAEVANVGTDGTFPFLEIFGQYKSFVEPGSQYPEKNSFLLTCPVVSTRIAFPLPPSVPRSLRAM